MYCVYVGFDYTYIDINALAQGYITSGVTDSLFFFSFFLVGGGERQTFIGGGGAQSKVKLGAHVVTPLSITYTSISSSTRVLQDHPVCGMVHIKEPLLSIEKSSPRGGSGFPLSLSEWSFTICLTPYNRK